MAKSNNPRFGCTGCKAKNTRNQLKGSNGRCLHCKTPMSNSGWLGGQAGSICQILGLSKGDEDELNRLALLAGADLRDLIRAAIQIRLNDWSNAGDEAAAVQADQIIGKLCQR